MAYWPIKNFHVQKKELQNENVEDLRWICQHTRTNKIRSKNIMNKMRVAFIMDKIREARLKSFEHVKRRCTHAPTKKCERLEQVGRRRMGER